MGVGDVDAVPGGAAIRRQSPRDDDIRPCVREHVGGVFGRSGQDERDVSGQSGMVGVGVSDGAWGRAGAGIGDGDGTIRAYGM
jgi:hypothetical protein